MRSYNLELGSASFSAEKKSFIFFFGKSYILIASLVERIIIQKNFMEGKLELKNIIEQEDGK